MKTKEKDTDNGCIIAITIVIIFITFLYLMGYFAEKNYERNEARKHYHTVEILDATKTTKGLFSKNAIRIAYKIGNSIKYVTYSSNYLSRKDIEIRPEAKFVIPCYDKQGKDELDDLQNLDDRVQHPYGAVTIFLTSELFKKTMN